MPKHLCNKDEKGTERRRNGDEEGTEIMRNILRTLDEKNMHPQLYMSSDLRVKSLSQTGVQIIQDDDGSYVLMVGLLRGLMIRLIH